MEKSDSLVVFDKDTVNHALGSYFDIRLEELAAVDPFVWELGTFLRDFTLCGGKRMRPIFAWTAFSSVNSDEDPAAVIQAVSSLELIQACALIHDDIIDASDSRRNAPTVHKRVEAYHADKKWAGSSSRFGENIAILLGDLALSWSDDMFHSSGISTQAYRAASLAWQAMRTEVINGQILDIANECRQYEDIDSALKVMRYKTAAYTIERPLHLGAAIAGASEEIITALREYGRCIGMAFQIRDDLLGVFGDPSITGKPAGDDLREGKRTLLLAYALSELDSSHPDKAHILRTQIGSQEAHIAELTDIISGTSAVEKCEDMIHSLHDQGVGALDSLNIHEQSRATLIALAHKATQRSF